MNTKINQLRESLISDLKSTSEAHLKTHVFMLEKGVKFNRESAKHLEQSIYFPHEIRGFNKAIDAIEDFFDAEEAKTKEGEK